MPYQLAVYPSSGGMIVRGNFTATSSGNLLSQLGEALRQYARRYGYLASDLEYDLEIVA